VDYVVEHCTLDWESYYPCHFMHLWWVLHEQVNILQKKLLMKTLVSRLQSLQIKNDQMRALLFVSKVR
jgi:hypothetical protein